MNCPQILRALLQITAAIAIGPGALARQASLADAAEPFLPSGLVHHFPGDLSLELIIVGLAKLFRQLVLLLELGRGKQHVGAFDYADASMHRRVQPTPWAHLPGGTGNISLQALASRGTPSAEGVLEA